LFIFTLFNVPPIESMSYNEPLVFVHNSTSNMTFHRHCMMNAEMVDLQASIYSKAVVVNVFLYTGLGLFLPTLIICVLSILLFRNGARIWNELHSHHSETENISLRYDSPIVEYLRTYNAAFAISIVFVFLSIPCKLLRLLVLFATNSMDDDTVSSNRLLVKAHAQMQTIGHAFELLRVHLYEPSIPVCIEVHSSLSTQPYHSRSTRLGECSSQRTSTNPNQPFPRECPVRSVVQAFTNHGIRHAHADASNHGFGTWNE
jgi:hypothetical protein